MRQIPILNRKINEKETVFKFFHAIGLPKNLNNYKVIFCLMNKNYAMIYRKKFEPYI